MILQTDGKRMHLLPAWPKEWDVEFNLHAPYNTIVEGRYVDGQFKDLVVTPPERSVDITIWEKSLSTETVPRIDSAENTPDEIPQTPRN